MIKKLLIVLFVCLIAACGGRDEGDSGVVDRTTSSNDNSDNSDNNDNTTDNPDDNPNPPDDGELSIYDLQDSTRAGHPAPESSVTVTGLVSAVDTSVRGDDPMTAGTFWLQEVEGGAYSGIEVFNEGARVDVSALQVGQTVEVTGTYVEYYDLSEIRLTSFEVVDEAIATVTPETVAPADVATGGALAESYEGVLVAVAAIDVVANDLGYGKFSVTGNLEIDDELYQVSPLPSVGQQFDEIVGVLTFTFDAVQLLPRTESDVGGFVAPEAVETTIGAVQDEDAEAHPSVGTEVILEGVVTAVDSSGWEDSPDSEGSFYIQTVTGGEYSGILVFNQGGSVDVSDLEVGQTVEVTGRYAEFEGLTEIGLRSVVVLDEELTQIDPVVLNPADIATDGSQAEAYEGVLVEVQDVEVTDLELGYGKFEVTGGLEIDDELYTLETSPTQNQTFQSIRGVLTYTFDTVQLNPRSADDVTE